MEKPWVNSYGHSLTSSVSLSAPEQQFDFTYKVPLLKSPLEQYYLMQGGFKRTDLNDTQADSTTLGVSRFWEMSSGWQRAINLRWSLDHFTQANVTNTTMLIYPGVSVNRTRSRGGLMPTWGDSQRYSVDYSNTMWGSDINFIVMQAQDVWIRTLYDRHRFVVRGNLGWIEADNFDKVPPDLRFFAGGDRSIRGYKYKSISPKDDDGKLIGASKLATGSLEYQYNVSGNGGAPSLSIAAKRSAIFARAISKRRRGGRALAVAGGTDQAGYRPADRRQRRAWFTVLHRSGA